MIETLLSITDFIKTTFYYGFYVSYKTGSVLVTFLNALFQFLTSFFENLLTFFTVLYESLAIFLQDNHHFLQQVFAFAVTSVDLIYSHIATIFCKISSFVYDGIKLVASTLSAIIGGTTAITTSIGQLIVLLKKLVILFGSGVWFLITLIPLLLYYVCTIFVSLVNRLYQEIYDICYGGVLSVKSFVKNIILFALDVPMESIAGILIALSLAYVFTQFYILISSYFKRKLRNLRNWYRRQRRDLRHIYQRTFGQRQITGNERVNHHRPARTILQCTMPSTTQSNLKQKSFIQNDEKYCVVCQERNKCILLLPCRHLCLCVECTRELKYYDEICPVCRSNIESTMKIYV